VPQLSVGVSETSVAPLLGSLLLKAPGTFPILNRVTIFSAHQATNVVLVDTLPDEVSFVSASHAGCDENVGIVTCNLGNLASGDSVDIAITVIAPNNVGTITNTAEVSSDIVDPALANNTASEATAVVMYQSYLPLTSK
jgi:hypothetical protein